MRATDSPPPRFTVFPTAGTQPLATHPAEELQAIPLRDRLKAIGLVSSISSLGIATLLVGSHLLNQNAEETLQPMAEAPSHQPFAPDLVPIITPVPIAPRSPSPSTDQNPAPAAARSAQSGAIRTNRDFSAIAQTNPVTTNPISPGSPLSPSPLPSSSPPPSPASASPPSRPFPVEFLAALLRAPEPNRSSSIAIAPGSSSPISPTPPQPSTQPVWQDKPEVTLSPISPPSPKPSTTTALPSSPPTSPPKPPTTTALPSSPLTSPPKPSTATALPASAPPPPPKPFTATARPPAPPPPSPPPPLRDRIATNQLQITGSTRFSQAELVAIVRKIMTARDPATGANPKEPTLTPAELVQVSEAITRLYTDRGYINSGAFVPADVLTGARPEIRVVEGSLEAINVKIQHPFLWLARPLSPNYVQGRLNRNIQLPLQIDQLADVVKLLEQDPMISSISTELAPGTTLGKSVLNVKVQQAPPLRVTLSMDNSRAPSVGTFQQQIGLSHTNILGLGDRWQISYNRSAGSQTLDLGFALPLNSRNGTLSLAYTNSRGEVIQEPFRDLGIKSRSQDYEIAFRQPLYQTSNELFAVSLRGTHYRNQGVFLEAFNEGTAIPFPARGSDINGNTRITALRFGQEWLKRGERDVLSLQSEFNVGINALNSTQLNEPPDGRFFYWRGSGFWVHAFAPDTLFALKGQLQFASRPLVPVEQISLGGINTVRGYQTDVLLADNGWFASAEFYLPVLRIPHWQGLLQVVPFIDAGRGWNLGFDQPDPSRLLSVGLGLQWKMGDKLRARLDWGVPLLNSTAVNGQSLRQSLFFSIIYTP